MERMHVCVGSQRALEASAFRYIAFGRTLEAREPVYLFFESSKPIL